MSAKKKGKKKRKFGFKRFLLVLIAFTVIWAITHPADTKKNLKKLNKKFGVVFNKQKKGSLEYIQTQLNPAGLDQVEINYGKSIDLAAETFNLPKEYLKSLCMLECSGRKIVKPRFEKHVYERLKKVQSGKLSNYEHVTPQMLNDATDEALRNLASSWGPFQLMGYKCLLLDIKIADIRGDDAVYWGVKWIDETYGNLLRKERFKDAFHMHNTGRLYPTMGAPKTYDPNYIPNGLKYMEYFKNGNKSM